MALEPEQLWKDDAHWRARVIYVCARDPRLIVAAKIKWLGWTFNFAHRTSFLVVLALCLAGVVPTISSIRENVNANVESSIAMSVFFVVAILIPTYRVGRQQQNL